MNQQSYKSASHCAQVLPAGILNPAGWRFTAARDARAPAAMRATRCVEPASWRLEPAVQTLLKPKPSGSERQPASQQHNSHSSTTATAALQPQLALQQRMPHECQP
uniref:Uncharacterized protein n=1 Tax=Chlamydomonas euryale TaxID=1486919 RepID=A0A7R9V9T4_9CHLO